MKFKGGMLGVCAVVLSILGTIILGTVLSIDETVSTRSDYRSIADVTGLVETTSDPYFTDYTPSANWTGYYTEGSDSKYISGVDYTTTSQANNYPVYDGTPVNTTGSIDLNGLPEGSLIPSGYDELRIYRSYNNYTSGVGYTSNPSITSLATIVNAIKTRTTISITFDGGSSTYNPTRAYITNQGNGVNTPFYPASGSKAIYGNSLWWGVGVLGNEYYITSSWTVDVNTQIATTIQNGTTRTYDANLVLVSWGGDVVQNGGSGYNVIPSTLTYTKTDANVQYMDITHGVRLNNYATSDNTIWDNGYRNGSLSMILKGTSGSSLNMEMDISSWNGTAWADPVTNNISVDWDTSGGVYSTTITVNGASKNIGSWNNVLLNINAELGTVEASPITSIMSYTNYTTGITIPVGTINKGSWEEISFIPVPGKVAPEMEVTSTRVYMDTYGAVFRNANLDLSSYFPDYPNYAVKFGNFALIGDSITINGNVLPVIGDAVEYDGNLYPIKDSSIVFDNGNVSLKTTEKDIDLGTTTTENIYFSGIWYVPLTFQEIYITSGTSYEWIPYGFGLDYNASVLVFIGLIVAVMFIAPLLKVKPKVMDWVVVVFAGIIGAGLLVV